MAEAKPGAKRPGAGKRSCAHCGSRDCYGGKDCHGIAERSLAACKDPEVLRMTRVSTALEGQHYMQLTRLEEVMRFAKEMGYRRLGVAYCIGLAEEAQTLVRILEQEFEVTAACCKAGGVPKEKLGLVKIRDDRGEAMCNPAGQALLLNEAKTDLNLLVGLCVGHDIILMRHSAAPVTTLVVKDRVLAHNPAGALHTGCWRKRLGLPR